MHLTENNRLKFILIIVVAIPIILSEILMLFVFWNNKHNSIETRYAQEAKLVYTNLYSKQDYASKVAKSLNTSRYVNDYITHKFESNLEYFEAYYEFSETTIFQNCIGIDNATITIYADNETIINGDGFGRLSSVRDSDWYKKFVDYNRKSAVIFYYDDNETGALYSKRKVAYVSDLDFFKSSDMERLVKIELSYSNLISELASFEISDNIYLNDLENNIILSNMNEYSTLMSGFKKFENQKESVYEETINLGYYPYTIIVTENMDNIIEEYANTIILIMFTIIIDSVLAFLLLRMIKLRLMQHQVEIQQMEISQKEAELLALRSQINPHFLFNALESIRMHCVIKQENETAEMVEKLALMQRQNVDWNIDRITIAEECRFVDAYLSLQKYRFGEKLSYHIEIADELKDTLIPKLTIVTFAENACIHGIEEKSKRGFVFIRVLKEDDKINIEVEDTGVGISNELAEKLSDTMNNATIEELQSSISEGKKRSHVGMLNACVRLKMMFPAVTFSVEGELNVGTIISIDIIGGEIQKDLDEYEKSNSSR